MTIAYLIPVWETITTSWEKVRGFKGTFWAALIILLLISIGFIVIKAILKMIAPGLDPLISFIVQSILSILQMGLLYLGILRAKDSPVSYANVFRSIEIPVLLRIIGVYILEILIFIIPALIIIIPNSILASMPDSYFSIAAYLFTIIGAIAMIVIGVRISLAMAFVLDEVTNPIEAISKSFKATQGNFWRLIGIYFVQLIIVAISAIPLGIGLIWTLPLSHIIYGLVYKRLKVNA